MNIVKSLLDFQKYMCNRKLDEVIQENNSSFEVIHSNSQAEKIKVGVDGLCKLEEYELDSVAGGTHIQQEDPSDLKPF